MLMRLADFVAETLVCHGIRHVFLITGGGAMHLNDAISRAEGLEYVCCHHEQACSMAAEGYARAGGKMAAVNVTTGPGGINALNGVFGAYTDSVPMIIVSGQVKRETCAFNRDLPGLRQLGDQEVDIVAMVRGITKYAVSINDPLTIRYHMERALYLAAHGRSGPTWVDIPVDVQGAMIETDDLKAYDPAEDEIAVDTSALAATCASIIDRIRAAKRPVILVGTGVRCADAAAELQSVAARLGIPVATAWTHDTIPSDHPCFCGRQGSIGDRAGNFTVQNSDFLLIVGSRMAIRQTSYNWENFARHAYKVQVDIDPAEMNKPTLSADEKIVCDAKVFLAALDSAAAGADPAVHAEWLAWCRERVSRYPVVSDKQRVVDERGINPYYFAENLWKQLADDDVVVCANATATIVTFQAAHVQSNQRLISNSGSASMGYDLPAAVGAAIARGGKRVVCVAGDGSMQLNVQELMTIAHHNLPVKIFVLDNAGYLSMRLTQGGFFKRLIGEGPGSGVSMPDMARVANAYGIDSVHVDSEPVGQQIAAVLARPGPCVAVVKLDPTQGFEPKLSSRQLENGKMVSAPLEDMFPFLSREELQENLLIPPLGIE